MWCGLRSLGLVVAAAVVAACGGGRATGSFDGNVYRNGPIAFQLPDPPAGWKRIDVDDASLAFRDDEHGASVLLNARCLSADDRTPLVALTNHLLIGATEREYLSQDAVPFDGREALHTKLKAKWDGVPMLIDVYVLSKDGCIYDFIYLGAPSGYEGGAPAFDSFVRGFRTLRGSGVAG
ncbi:MAG: hypothetical protein KIS78_18790 [Labilithrix sp.]|nr:hypothetical protein [Labilithrix sp.]MCW5834455.1 hypothetical protein [Labilithrix sp.]